MVTNWAQKKTKNPNTLIFNILGFTLVTSTGFKPYDFILIFIGSMLNSMFYVDEL